MSREPVTFDNDAWAGAGARLSVLMPFMRDDPRGLLQALDREAAHLDGAVELVVLDDGGGDDALAEGVLRTVAGLQTPARFVRLFANEGRAKGRNRLADQARSPHLLFLDSDMLPDDERFLGAYLDLIAADNPAVVIGGFSVLQAPLRREHAVHRAIAQRSDCLGAEARRLTPEKYVFTSNLLVRRDVFDAETFDEAFAGWGWEDVEWGMRIARRWPIIHIDNAATHLGLDTAPSLAAKYRQSVGNFARVAKAHPEIVSGYPSYKVARMLRRLPLIRLWRPMLATLAQWDWAPAAPRAFALRLYRSALYAEVV